jgi:hypothetical protein
MYVSNQMLRVNHDEWLRYAETRRLIKQASVSSPGAARRSRRLRVPRPAFRFGRLASQG